MNWLQRLFSRERIEEEKRADQEFRAQIKEALLQQDNLREAVAQMKKAREACESSPPSRAFRRPLSSQT